MKHFIFVTTLLVGLCLGSATHIVAQLSWGGKPKEVTFNKGLRNSVEPLAVFVPYNKEDLLATSQWQNGLYQVGRAIDVKTDFFDHAQSATASDGTQCYQLELTARDAVAISVTFSQFLLPQGAKFFIFTPTEQLGAFMHETNPSGKVLATAPLEGNRITLRYEAPKNVAKATIVIDHIGYLFRNHNTPNNPSARNTGKEGASTNCEVNANCSEGNKLEKQKDALVQIYLKAGKSYAYCTGTVVNNTAEDFTPYILTAAHCRGDKVLASEEDFKEWVFSFHYLKPNCQNNYRMGTPTLSLTGAELVSFLPINGKSDGMLLKLLAPIPPFYGVYYAGWNRQEQPAEGDYRGLHHPQGDVMKVSTTSKLPDITTYKDKNSVGAKDAFLNVTYEKTQNGHGVTEGGSSGSPLFNNEGLVIGTLSGGNSSCTLPLARNIYGRLAYHWDKFEPEGTSIAKALDPVGKGTAIKLEGKYQSGTLTTPALFASFIGATTLLNDEKDSYTANFGWEPVTNLPDKDNWKLYIWKGGDSEPITSLNVGAMWMDKVTPTKSGTITYTFRYGYTPSPGAKPIYLNPSHYTLLTKKPQGVRNFKQVGKKLSWEKPIIFQRVTNIAPGDTEKLIQLDDYRDFSEPYFRKPIKTIFQGSLFNGAELKHVVGKSIVAIGFYPARTEKIHTYSVFVRNGVNIDASNNYKIGADTHETYTEQAVPSPYKELAYREVKLAKPFIITNNALLVAGVKTDTKTDFESRAVTATRKKLPEAWNNSAITHYHPEQGKEPFNNRWATFDEAFPAQDGYSAVNFVLCDANNGENFEIPADMPYGPFPMLFPKLIGYKVVNHKTGATVETITDPETLGYTATTDEEYEVIPLYRDFLDGQSTNAIQIPTEQMPKAVPTTFSDKLTLYQASNVVEISFYNLAGEKILVLPLTPMNNIQKLDVNTLPQGACIAVYTLSDGKQVIQKLTKK